MIEAWHWACLKRQTLSQLLNRCLSLFLKVSRSTQEIEIQIKKGNKQMIIWPTKSNMKRVEGMQENHERKISYICMSNVQHEKLHWLIDT